MKDPFKIDGPAVISFSGGRTSGMMTDRVIDAHGGTLPTDVKIVFENTGLERAETLNFVERCSAHWDAEIVWLEYRHTKGVGPWYERVNYATASREGEPLEAAITARAGDSGFLPNPITRYCTIETKILTTIRYIDAELGWGHWTNAIGFRADEPERVAKLRKAIREEREDAVAPMAKAGITRADVLAFWERMPFDLRLEPHESNCNLCFLKKRGEIARILHDHPEFAPWWIRMESMGGRFRKDRPSYAALLEHSKRPTLFPLDEADELSVACHCTD